MKLIVCFFVILSLFASFTAEARPQARPDGLRYFGTGPARCPARSLEMHDLIVDNDTKITFLGTIPARRYEYWIYFHEYYFNHGTRITRRIVIMGRDCRYLGQYYVTADPIGVRGNDILFDVSIRYGNVIRFTNRLPPARIWIDGEIHQFER
jgi:hypothetical protein